MNEPRDEEYTYGSHFLDQFRSKEEMVERDKLNRASEEKAAEKGTTNAKEISEKDS